MEVTANRVLDAVASRGLDTYLELPRAPLDEAMWAQLAAEASGARLWGELADAVSVGDLPATDAQATEVFRCHEAAMGTALELEALSIEVIDLLAGAGLPVRLLKGMATAHLDHPDPMRRSFSDVDLLVSPGRFGATIGALEHAGWRRDLPERAPGFDERFGKDATLERDRWGQIDLHRTLVIGAYGLWIDLDELWTGAEPFTLGGHEVWALDAVRRLLHACYAAVLSDPQPRLALIRDIGLLSDRRPDRVEKALELARTWHGEAVVVAGLRLAAQRLGLAGALRCTDATWTDRAALRSYRSFGGSNTALRLAGALAIPGWRNRAAYLNALARPSADYRAARTRSGRPAEWRSGARELLRRR
ncbi:MAG: nucleotidyltransferase family protein [Acidimicrobiales bacterium]